MTLSIASFSKACTKTVPGNYDHLFVVPYGDIDEVTWSDNEATAITMVAAKKFADVEADLDGIQYTSSGEAQRGYMSEQNLIAKFTQKTATLEKLVSELINNSVCGLVAIRIDRNGKGWVSGIAPAVSQLKNMPYTRVTEEFDSGENMEATEEGNRYTVTLTRMSATREYPIAGALVTTILAGTDDFIDGHSST